MDHVVFHPGPDGAPAFHRFSSLDESVRFVEHLRNVEGVEDVSVNMLTPVPLAFRAYYKVEMPAAEPMAVPVQPVDAEPVEAPMAEMAPADVLPEPEPAAASNGKHSLGFFSH